MVRNYQGSDKWIPSIVRAKLGPVTYNVEVSQGDVLKRHTDQLRQKTDHPQDTTDTEMTDSCIVQDNYKYPELPDKLTPEQPSEATGRRYPECV